MYFIHGFGDGRDTDPRSGIGYVKNLLDHLEKFKWESCFFYWKILCHGP